MAFPALVEKERRREAIIAIESPRHTPGYGCFTRARWPSKTDDLGFAFFECLKDATQGQIGTFIARGRGVSGVSGVCDTEPPDLVYDFRVLIISLDEHML